MIDGKKVLGLIPARGGSKGIPRKNIREVGGKPLIAWTIEEAKKSQHIDRLVLSSEDQEIIEVAKRCGCEVPFVRPAELAKDDTPGVAPVLHALKELPGYDYVVLLQPTSPLRRVDDIDGCIEKCIYARSKSCVSVKEVDESPFHMYLLDKSNKIKPLFEHGENFSCRQDLPKVHVLNGAVYVAEIKMISRSQSFVDKDTVAYEMLRDRSVDIDTELDLRFADLLLSSCANNSL